MDLIKKLSICVVTGSRADYSHLFYPIKRLADSSAFNLQLVVTGMHLSAEFGNTIKYIKKDGLKVTKEVPILVLGDDALAVSKSISKGIRAFANVFEELNPDILMVLGDRFEILAVVQAALIFGIPVAHIGGGDVTRGAFDDAIRHSITKMSHIHFVTNELSGKRVLQMGEYPGHVHVVGAPSLDIINEIAFISRDEFFDKVRLGNSYKKYILVTYHSETLSDIAPANSIFILLNVLSKYKDSGIIITGANADTGGKELNKILQDYAAKNENVVFHMSLGKETFYTALKYVDVFIGNSSSGLYEAPSFKLPVVNIGDRQQDRMSTESVINCRLKEEEIEAALIKAFDKDCSNVINPYGDGTASKKILAILEAIKEPKALLKKKFFDYV